MIMAEQTQAQKDTARAASRLNTDNIAQSTNDATRRDTQASQERTEGSTIADRMESRIAMRTAEPSFQVVFTELQTPLTTPQLPSFPAVICVNGQPQNATIYGAITGA